LARAEEPIVCEDLRKILPAAMVGMSFGGAISMRQIAGDGY
jgi:hypothetical protein